MESTDFVTVPLPPELPPGFRFHPTDEELVIHYLKKKAAAAALPVSIIADVDIYKYDPWELPEKALFGEKEWYFFSPRERKYPNGARPNRAALSGYWKATGTDKAVVTRGGAQKVGVKKALVFYGGKPPKGIKTNWIMHEYRLPDNKAASKPDFSNKKASSRLDDWVLCRIYKKTAAAPKDQEKDEIKDMNNSMAGNLLPPIGQHTFLSNDPNPMAMMIKAWGMSQAMPQLDLCSLPTKRSLPSSYSSNYCGDENLASTKRLLSENCTGPTDETSVNFFSTMLNYQVSQQNPQQTVLGSAQDGVFGLNWYS